MLHKSHASLLDRFQFNPEDLGADILITACPKTTFTVHPDESHVIESCLVSFYENRWQLVDNDLYSKQFVKGLLRADIYDCMDIDGNRFLLISTYPLSGELTSWRESVLDVIDNARGNWIKMRKVVDGYDFQVINNIKHKPRWSKQGIDEFVLDAFGGNIITADNLPVSLAGNKPEYHNRRY